MASPSDASTKLPLLGVVALALGGAAVLATVKDGEGPKSPKPPADAGAKPAAAAPAEPEPPADPAALRTQLNRFFRARDLQPPPERCLAEDPEVVAWLAATAALLQEGRPKGDRPEDRAALARFDEPSGGAEAYAEYAFLQAKARLHTGAEDDDVDDAYETAQSHCRIWVDAFLDHGRVLMARGKPKLALGRIREVRSQADDIPEIRYRLAEAMHAVGDAKRAALELDELLEAVPDHVAGRRLRGRARLEMKDAAGAAADLKLYLAKRSQDGVAQLWLGQALTATKDRAAAKAAFCAAKGLGVDAAAAHCPD